MRGLTTGAAALRRAIRRGLFGLATGGRLESAARRFGVVERLAYGRARRYVAGATLEEAVGVLEELREQGLAASLDYFGEQVGDPHAAAVAADRYVQLASRLERMPGDVHLSIDLSHVGADVSADFCRRQVERIATALPAGRRLQVGAEDAARTDRILDVVHGAAGAGAPVMATVQANLRRSPADAAWLAGAGIPIRLVKGAYAEPPELALAWGEETDLAFLRLAHELRAGGAEVVLATHDAVLREALLAVPGGFGVEMLLGVRPDDARAVARRGVPVRIYVPYGENWFRYWMRRVAESVGA